MKYFRIRPLIAIPATLITLYGFWLVYHPLAFILGGICLLAAFPAGQPAEKPKDGKVNG